MRILVSGSLAYDKIMEYPGRFSDHIMPDKIHAINLSFVSENLVEHFGGTAGNIAYGLALLGEKPSVLAAAGRDFQPYRDWLEKIGVDLNFARVISDKPTTLSNIMTDSADNQIAALCLGAMAHSCEIKDDEIPIDAFAIISPGNIDDMLRFPMLYREKKIPFIFDPGQQIPQLSADALRNGITGAKVFISNDYELALVLEKTGWTEEDMLERVEILVTTLGEKGSRIRAGKDVFEIPASSPRKIVDPTGAGDAYRAGFIKGLLASWPLEVAGKFAGVMAAYAVEVYGTQEYSTSFSDARTRYKENFGTDLFTSP
ncbi:MAG: hypothetical protein A3B13_01425 [Candidatus Liptonbacteria bacterium RIFCSPLOWO2_01_FULL_45_15]|uniref:Carbohydrate kinase PfkB domain-containing protein n=1 Tax=Candidatus Liptonbacteria bacterium RIFCSPLOWO2_01_FULL_45_15 TaxID=1798649 RepID=A0A1G2CE88_9BACT|nr:MAG: hypothetical protein A3B13_01425 [Candidatus Liptonbacteria bacterium RIFCSPLOWO2_01_FULL_45_15]